MSLGIHLVWLTPLPYSPSIPSLWPKIYPMTRFKCGSFTQRSIPLSICSLGLPQSVQPAPDFGNRLRGGNYCSRRQFSRRVASRGPGLWHTFSHQLPPAPIAPVESRHACGIFIIHQDCVLQELQRTPLV